MPTYQYRCTDCGEDLEVFQKFSDDALTVCPSCDGELRKVFSAVGVVFKGSGFYATDSRKESKATKSAGKSSDGGGSERSGNDGAAKSDAKPATTKSESKPAAAAS